MRHVLIAAAALAVCGLVASTAKAQVVYQAGGPNKIGNMCKVVTDDRGDDSYGYYEACKR